MNTRNTQYIVQYENIYKTFHKWEDHTKHYNKEEALIRVASLRNINPNVRIIKRTITEEEIKE